jgi:hypothetical protein
MVFDICWGRKGQKTGGKGKVTVFKSYKISFATINPTTQVGDDSI